MRTAKSLILILALCLTTLLTACNPEPAAPKYGDPAEYAGVWQSGVRDSRAFLLYGDGRYELYSVRPGSPPEDRGSGLFKPRDGILNFAEGGTEEHFAISSQAWDMGDGVIDFEGFDFTRTSEDPDFATVEALTEFVVPLEAYLGEWENDTVVATLTISDAEYSMLRDEPDGSSTYSSGTFLAGRESLLFGYEEEEILTMNEDGSLSLSGMEGTFFPKGSGNAALPAYTPYIGYWHNSELDFGFEISDGGYLINGALDGGAFSLALTPVEFEDGIMILELEGERRPATLNDDGTLALEGMDGLFVRGGSGEESGSVMPIEANNAGEILLLPENADLSAAPNVILEPEDAPYNLGGWLREDVVTWQAELPVSGMYHVAIEYSRPANYPKTNGVILVQSESETIDLEFYAEPTGTEGTADDWSNYSVRDNLGFRTEAGPVTISVYESTEETTEEMPPNFINLRGITLVCEEEDTE